MHILYLISYAGRAGTEKYVYDLMRVFSSRGHKCGLVFSEAGPLSEKAAASGFPTACLDMSPGRILRSSRVLAALCRENGVDVIHAQYPRENVIAILSRLWRPGTRVVFTSHLTVSQGPLWRICNRLLTPFDSAVISVCSPGVDLLRENSVCGRRICRIPNGVEVGDLPPRRNILREEFGLSEDCFVFLSFARYVPEKGLDVLLYALHRLRSLTERPFVCMIAGEGELFGQIRALAHSLDLTKNVIQTGYRADTEALLCSADAYVSSAVSAEAMSYSILEGMRCALPIAVTDVGAGAELAEGCGFVSPPGDAGALALALLRLLGDPAEGRRLGEKARERVIKEFDLEKTSRVLEKIYQL